MPQKRSAKPNRGHKHCTNIFGNSVRRIFQNVLIQSTRFFPKEPNDRKGQFGLRIMGESSSRCGRMHGINHFALPAGEVKTSALESLPSDQCYDRGVVRLQVNVTVPAADTVRKDKRPKVWLVFVSCCRFRG